jgi:Domain of unknown function (DUF4162)
MESLKVQSWVQTVQIEQNLIRVTVTDLMRGKQALLPLVAKTGQVINRLQWVRPSLEEIFLKISA